MSFAARLRLWEEIRSIDNEKGHGGRAEHPEVRNRELDCCLLWTVFGADRNRADDLLLAKQHRLSAVLPAVAAGRRAAKVAVGAQRLF